MKKLFLPLTATLAFNFSLAQQVKDSTELYSSLPDVTVKAFEQNKASMNVPAAINLINKQALGLSSPTSIVQAVNITPGVRMEERSPGSYRFNIRGSSLRSPFGVRNVKVYYNDIPITDPGGQTYLNELGYYNFNSIEIIKGPASSLYGAGTGGTMLIESMNQNEQAGVSAAYTTGSYGLQNIYAGVSTGSEKLVSRGTFQHQQNDGYRNQSALRRDIHSWTGLFKMNEKKFLKISYLYGDLFYETPGALTKAEYDANPRAARPAAGGFPSAEQAKASIRERMFLAGLSYVQHFAPKWENKSVLYGMFTELRNPAIRNYGKNSEPHVGGRTSFSFTQPFNRSSFKFIFGGEWQEGFSSVAIHKNVNGSPDSLRTYDEIHNRQQMIFSQASLDINGGWSLIGGASWNWLNVRFERFSPAALGFLKRKFDNQIAPRIALMKKLKLDKNEINIYSSVSKGFSPPTRDELVPTGGAINLELNAEDGVNYDVGIKAKLWSEFYVDANAFWFGLRNTIVQRRDAGGGDYYTNAGKTNQHGIETTIRYPLFQNKLFEQSLFWISHTWHDFHYSEFKQLTSDYSGKQMPGDAKHAFSTGIDAITKGGFNTTLTYYYSGKIPLNDANTAYANAYNIVGAKIGYKKQVGDKWQFRLNAGIDNLLNEKYSLGNDLNAAGGRYYNAAPVRNYYVSVIVQWISKKILL
ncbi:MAG TPA: TonB-dependent receptor plug domain-containing protein [Flavisolibacter sp.]|jgi:iron complex outermembrane receptor protein|nr:TonB-dependent receptor plug domain-containing protein [Flavisolibacter sp.]